jgi:hypothetical protein
MLAPAITAYGTCLHVISRMGVVRQEIDKNHHPRRTIMIRILDFPTTVGLNDELKRLRDSEYVVSTKAADTALLLLRKEMFFEPIHAIPHR